MREDYYAGLEDRYFLTFEQAKENKLKIDFEATPPAPAPKKLGITLIDDVKIADVVPYIDWVRVFCFHINLLSPACLIGCKSLFFLSESILSNLGTAWSLSQSWLPEDFQRRSGWWRSKEAV